MPARVLLSLLSVLLCLPAAAQRLVTESYDITIESRCKEGVVSCNSVNFAGIERKTGKTLRLKGEDLHTRCADGVTPCRFLGHVFRHGKLSYIVWENGWLAIKDGKKALLEEQGSWSDEESSWHGKWHAVTETGKDGRLCMTAATGAGGHRFVVKVEPGGFNSRFYFEAVAQVRGRPLGEDDEVLLRLEGKRPKLYDYDVWVVLPDAAQGVPSARISMPDGYAPELVRGMRSANSVAVLRAAAGPGNPEVLARFPLQGFAASFGKLAEWCKFHPDKLFQS